MARVPYSRKRNSGGGGTDMKSIQKQMQQMQEELEKAQEELSKQEMTATAGGGMVEATVNGDKDIVSIKIDPDVMNPEEVDIVEDMVVAAINEALRMVNEESDRTLGKFTQGINIPGL